MSHQELIISLTIIRKVTSNKDFAPLLYFVYTKDEKHDLMYEREIYQFQKENKSFKKNATKEEELEGEVLD